MCREGGLDDVLATEGVIAPGAEGGEGRLTSISI